ncbi:MAG: hypothetical protein JWM28_94 [Chitinophagaceae bacterium]|nr:hypothetical protein [Chitinophagaceae bacterium]
MKPVIAKCNGQFTPLKIVGATVTVNDVIGKIWYGGIWNNQYSPAAGTVAFILPAKSQVLQNVTKICDINTTVPAVSTTSPAVV